MIGLKLIAWALGCYAGLLALIFVMQGRLLFMPDTKSYTQEQVGALGYLDITTTTADGLTLHGWYAAPQGDKPTIILFHGNASTWQWRAPDFRPLVADGYGVLLAGYRGYGGNPGMPSEKGLYEDAEAWLKIPQSRKIVLYGESLGTGVAVEMATRHPGISGLILEVPYSSIAEVASFHYPFVLFIDVLLKNKFNSLEKIDRVKTPKLFLLAGEDRVIPQRFGLRLFEKAAEPKKLNIYPAAGHADIRHIGGIDDVKAFLKTL